MGILCVAISAAGAQTAVAQEPDASQSSASVERVRAALQSAPSITDHALFAPAPDTMRLGPLTFVPPETPGQFVAVRVPIGAFASRAAHSLAVAQHHRVEGAARRAVAQVVVALQKTQAK